MIAPLAALTIGIVSAWQVNAARPVIPKASAAEVIGVVDLRAVVVAKRTRSATKLQRALVSARTETD